MTSVTTSVVLPPIRVPLESLKMHTFGQRQSTAWTPHEDEILLNARASGMNWPPIQQTHFPLKTPNACRKRHERLMERRRTDDWDMDKLDTMAKLYMRHRKEMWAIPAAQMGEKWQVVETKCMEMGFKNVQSAGRSALRRERLASGMDEGSVDDLEADDDSSVSQDPNERSEEDVAASERRSRMLPLPNSSSSSRPSPYGSHSAQPPPPPPSHPPA